LRATLVAVGLGVASVWVGVWLSYQSYYWPPVDRGWPVSFFVVALVFVSYLASGLPRLLGTRRAARVASAAATVQAR
jgi:zinc/manganese transport system permease protein